MEGKDISQSMHAGRVQSERRVMENFACTRNQARMFLKRAADIANRQRLAEQAARAKEDKRLEEKFQPRVENRKLDPLPAGVMLPSLKPSDNVPREGVQNALQTIDACFASVRGTINLRGEPFVPA